MKALEFIFEDTEIHFLLGNEKNVMINATEMAKLFDRRIDFFLKTEPTKAFSAALEFPPTGGNSEVLTRDDLIQTKGHQGTYFHRILALKFAAWLDPRFEVWIYYKIEEILFGNTKAVAVKISDAEIKKQEIEDLRKELIQEGNEKGILLLQKQAELKIIEGEKKKAMTAFTNQLRIF